MVAVAGLFALLANKQPRACHLMSPLSKDETGLETELQATSELCGSRSLGFSKLRMKA
jgi:hypothetical protein